MGTDTQNEFLVTGDTDGNLAVWELAQYALIENATESSLIRKEPRTLYSSFLNIMIYESINAVFHARVTLSAVLQPIPAFKYLNKICFKALKSRFQPHRDIINSIELCRRSERLLIISASADMAVVVSDVYGNQIGIFGQVCFIYSLPSLLNFS